MKEAIAHFEWWLRMRASGCVFAASLATRGRVAYEPHSGIPGLDDLDQTFDLYAQQELTVVVLLPFVPSERGLVQVLMAPRATSSRWKVRDRGAAPTGDVLVGLEWTTANGDISEAMGFAPLPSMPVPRRAPYFAIAAWPGGHRNPERGMKPTPAIQPGAVGFLDASHGLRHDVYEKMWTETRTAVADLMVTPPDSAKRYLNVAFALSASAASGLTFDP